MVSPHIQNISFVSNVIILPSTKNALICDDERCDLTSFQNSFSLVSEASQRRLIFSRSFSFRKLTSSDR